jgi:uncharacterized protein (TIGR03435 family)
LAYPLSTTTGRPVVDKTGVEGKFDVRLEFAPDSNRGTRGDVAPPGASDKADIFTAVKEQLGLKLEATKGSVEMLVVDRVEQPSGN